MCYVGQENFKKDDFLHNILKVTGTHEDDTAIPVQPGSKRARVSTDTSTATPEKKDLLTELFERMRPYCKPGTFVYNILMTIFRHVLIMNKVYEYGRNVWHGNPEGEDVLRFWIVYGTIVGTSAIDLLRGGAIAKRAKRFLPGVPEIFDGGLQNLPGVPGPRQVHYYSATPYPLKDIVRVSALMVDAALEALGGPEGLVLGVTFDCVHGESRLEVVRDIDGEYVVLGPASPDGLKGAARGKDDFDDDKALGGKDIAKKLMTVVLHVFNGEHVDREVCIAVVPLNEETGKIIANVFLELRRLCFEKGSWLIFAGGDGASPNRDAWKIIKGKSPGDKTPLFEKVKKAEELPFWSGSDMDQHDTKGLKRDIWGDWILAKGQQIRFDILLTRLRGIVPTENGEVTLSEPGDPTYSRVDDVSLTDKLGEQRAKEFHQEFADLATMEVVDPKDSMASKPAHLCGKMGDLFREAPSRVRDSRGSRLRGDGVERYAHTGRARRRGVAVRSDREVRVRRARRRREGQQSYLRGESKESAGLQRGAACMAQGVRGEHRPESARRTTVPRVHLGGPLRAVFDERGGHDRHPRADEEE